MMMTNNIQKDTLDWRSSAWYQSLSFVLAFNIGFFFVVVLLIHPCLMMLWFGFPSEVEGGTNSAGKNGNEMADVDGSCGGMGHIISFLVVGWNLAFAAWTYLSCRAHHGREELYYMTELNRQWKFSILSSVFMVLPDYFLVNVLGTLYFPDDGVWKIGGAVSWYMCGMWAIPFLLILSISSFSSSTTCFGNDDQQLQNKKENPIIKSGYDDEPNVSELLCAAAVALAIFGTSEHILRPLNIWHAREENIAHMMGPSAAMYVLPAEALLGCAILFTYRKVRNRCIIYQFFGCLAVMLMYTGSLAISFLLLERQEIMQDVFIRSTSSSDCARNG